MITLSRIDSLSLSDETVVLSKMPFKIHVALQGKGLFPPLHSYSCDGKQATLPGTEVVVRLPLIWRRAGG